MTYLSAYLVCVLLNEFLGLFLGFKLGYFPLFLIASAIAKALNRNNKSDQIDFNMHWNDLPRSVPQAVLDHCSELSGDVLQLENYLNVCANDRLIKRRYICAILEKYASPEDFAEWFQQNNPELLAKKASANNSSQNKVSLANILKGQAPDAVLQHCDSISDKKILLETYLMQCENQGKISHETAAFLLEQYTGHLNGSQAQAALLTVQEKTRQEAQAAGLSLYAYVKSQLPESVRITIEEKFNDLDALEDYLKFCLDQKLISEYYYEVIWEEGKGNCALRRLQSTGGRYWDPHDILQGLAPENILDQCDCSYGMQNVYLDQQVQQNNVTRQTADLILNIYTLAKQR